MHDIADLERRGLPGVFVASSTFVDAAAAQSAALGVRPAAVFVPHPIQDRTDDEMRALADAAVDELLARLTGPTQASTSPPTSAPDRPAAVATPAPRRVPTEER